MAEIDCLRSAIFGILRHLIVDSKPLFNLGTVQSSALKITVLLDFIYGTQPLLTVGTAREDEHGSEEDLKPRVRHRSLPASCRALSMGLTK